MEIPAQIPMAVIRERYREQDAVLFDSLDSSIVPELSTEDLVRGWKESLPDLWSETRAYFELYSSTKNVAQQRYVDDPIASTEVHKGRYRHSFLRRVQRQGIMYIVQVLRRGYYEAPDWSAARIFQSRQMPGNAEAVTGVADTASDSPERYLIVEFRGVEQRAEAAFVAALSGGTFTNPNVGGSVYKGLWHGIYVTTEQADDGFLTVRLLLARPQFTLNAYADIGGWRESDIVYLWNVPKDLSQTIITAWRNLAPTKGKTATCSYNTAQGVVDIVLRKRTSAASETNLGVTGLSCAYSETSISYLNESDPLSRPLPVTPHSISANVGLSYRRQVDNNGDGTFNITITTRQRKTQGPLSFASEVSHGRTVTSRETRGWLGGYAVYDAAYPQPDPPAIGTTYVRDVSINEDCSLDIVDRIVTSKPLDRKTIRRTVVVESSSTGKVNDALDSAAIVALDATAVVQGETLVLDRQQQPDGTTNYDKRIDVSPVLENVESTATILKATVGSGVENKRDPMPTATAPTIGKTVKFRRTKNPDGTYTYTEIIEDSSVSPARARVYEVASCRALSATTVERNIAQDLYSYDPGVPPAGTVRVVRLTENLDGSWDREIQDRAAPVLTSTENVVRTKGGVTVSITRNQTGAKPAVPGVTQGVTKTQRIDDNQDCSFDVTVREETAPNLVVEVKEFIRGRTTVTTAASAATTPVKLEAVTGKAIRGSNRERVDGTWETEKTEESPEFLSANTVSPYWVPYNDKYGTSYFVAFSNATSEQLAAIIGACTSETNNSISAVVNRYGTFDGSGSRVATNDGGGGGGGGGGDTKDFDVTFTVTWQGKTYTIREGVDNSRANAKEIVEAGGPHPIIPGYKHQMHQVRDGKWYFCTVNEET